MSARKRFLVAGAVMLFILSAGIVWIIYDYGVSQTRTDAARVLEAVARLKSAEISDWYEDQMYDVHLIAGNDELVERFGTWRDTRDSAARSALRDLLQEFEDAHEIERLLFCSADGQWLSPHDSTEDSCDARLRLLLPDVASTGQSRSTGLYRCNNGAAICIDFITPMNSTFRGRPVFLVARADPERTIFPMVEHWPLPSRSAEAYLVKHRGDSLAFLSNLRFSSGAALRKGYRRPDLREILSEGEHADGAVSQGTDYRGVEVLSYVIRVPHTSWHIVAEMDESEVFASAWSQTRLTIIMVISSSIAIIALALFFDSRHQTRAYRRMLALELQYTAGQRELEQELRKSERQFRAMFEDHRAVKMVVDAYSGAILDANRAAVQFYGWSREQLRSMTIHEINTLPSGMVDRAMRETTESDRMHYEMRHRCADGSVRDVEVFAAFLEFDGRDAIYSVIHDVTEKKQAEQWSRLLGRAVEQSSANVLIITFEGTILYANPELAATLGSPVDSIVGQSIDNMNLEELKQQYSRIWLQVVRRKMNWQGEFLVHNDGGAAKWLRAEISPVIDDLGVVSHVIIILSDISEEKKLIEDLTQAKERAEESDRLKSAFLANMSHEIRTPLNAIIGFADLLTTPALPENELKEYSDVITQRSYDLLSILNDILDISMIEAGQITLVEEVSSVQTILQDLYATFRQLLQQEGKTDVELRVVNELDETDDCLVADAFRLRQVLTVFLSNAMKFTSEGTITFGCRGSVAARVQFFVSDTGIGMDAEHLAIIFDRFRQVESGSTRRFEGNGLGLSIAKGIVELMGGSISVESRKGEGSTFSFIIPHKFCT